MLKKKKNQDGQNFNEYFQCQSQESKLGVGVGQPVRSWETELPENFAPPHAYCLASPKNFQTESNLEIRSYFKKPQIINQVQANC